MNREIKFRGKRVDNGEWVYGFLFELNADGCSITCIGTEPLSANDYSEIYSSCYGEVIPETVGQYTGAKDKKNKKIYEGDIVEYRDFSNGLYLFREQPKSMRVIRVDNLLSGIYLKGLGSFEGNKVEVIGSKHDNPQLLEVQDE